MKMFVTLHSKSTEKSHDVQSRDFQDFFQSQLSSDFTSIEYVHWESCRFRMFVTLRSKSSE